MGKWVCGGVHERAAHCKSAPRETNDIISGSRSSPHPLIPVAPTYWPRGGFDFLQEGGGARQGDERTGRSGTLAATSCLRTRVACGKRSAAR